MTYRDLHGRAKRLANALDALGVNSSDRVATLAWNGYRHMELYFAVVGKGAVLDTINPRLAPDQIAWMVNHAEDRYLFFDLTFLPTVEKIAPVCRTVKAFVAMTDRAHMPATTSVENLLCYEDLLAQQPDTYEWPTFDENRHRRVLHLRHDRPSEGRLYSHRSTLLHAFALALPDAMNFSAREAVLPVVPMFHVNAWGIPYAGALVGAKLVFPGAALDGKSLHELIEAEGVTFAAGVPTVWQALLNHRRQHALRFSTMKRTIVGGARCRPDDAHVRRALQRRVVHAWGMTESSPPARCVRCDPSTRGWKAKRVRSSRSRAARCIRCRHEDRRRRRRRAALGRQDLRRTAGRGPVDRN